MGVHDSGAAWRFPEFAGERHGGGEIEEAAYRGVEQTDARFGKRGVNPDGVARQGCHFPPCLRIMAADVKGVCLNSSPFVGGDYVDETSPRVHSGISLRLRA